MIPIQLTLKGIYSYQKEHTIDFTKLLEGKIFGIFGLVASGKSTILEAISFALYGETERLHQRDNRNYNMMNLKSDELLIDFIFKSGKEETEYRFIVKGKRNKKQFDNVKPFDRKAFKKVGGDWEPIEETTAEKIIGLSYDNFRRTIIIPQDKFQEFLQLGDKDRTQMLKEIFHLNKFELFYKVVSLERKNNIQKENLQGRLFQLGEIKEDAIEVNDEKLITLENEVKDLEENLETKEKTEKKQDKLKELFDKLKTHKEHLDRLIIEEPKFKRLEEKIKSYEYCVLNFKSLLERTNELNNAIKTSSDELQQKQKKLNETLNDLKIEEEKFKSIKEDHNNRDKLNRNAEELQKISEIKILDIELNNLQEKLKKGEHFLQDTVKKIKELQYRQKQLTSTIKEKKKELPDQRLLSEIQYWFIEKKHITDHVKQIRQEIEAVQSEINQAENQKNEIVSKYKVQSTKYEVSKLVNIDIKETAIPDIIEAFNYEKETCEKQTERFRNEENHLLTREKLEEIGINLKEGDACPVCGSIEHPLLHYSLNHLKEELPQQILNFENVKEQLTQIREKQSATKQEEKLLSETIQKLDKLQVQLQQKEGSLNKTEQNLQTLKDKSQAHFKQFTWQGYSPDDEKAVKAAFEIVNKINKEIEDSELIMENIQNETEKKNNLKEQADEKLAKLKEEKQTKASKRDTLSGQLKTQSYDDYKQISSDDIQQEIIRLQEKIKQVEQKYELSERDIISLKQEKDILSGQINEVKKQHEKDRDYHAAINQQLQQKVESSTYSTIEEITEILQVEIDISSEKEQIDTYNKQLHTVKEQFHQLQKETKGQSFDEDQYYQLKQAINSLKSVLEEKKKEVIRLQEAIKKIKSDLQQKKKIEKKLGKIVLRGEDINTLKQLFRGSGFVNYISSVHIQNLCNAANKRFYKLTRQNLRLEVTENNNFQVRDFLNNGYVRSVKTLSGGQTFQAALSLALALAENIQLQNQAKQNFFFLDEGFGSQDKESLQIVFDTLKSLRKENRIVGIISHVEELQDEIDIYLHIKNDEEQGSMITSSWLIQS